METKIGKMIDRYRKRDGLTLEELGKRLDKSPSAVSRWISGDRSPMVDDLIRLTELFDTDIESLLYGETVTNHMRSYPFCDGTTIHVADDSTPLDHITLSDSVMGQHAGSSHITIVRTHTDSMDELIPTGSLIATRETTFNELNDGDIVIYLYDGSLRMNEIHNDTANGRFILRPRSTNGFHADHTITYEDAANIQFIGKVVMSVVHFE